jgi:hypothetical protein
MRSEHRGTSASRSVNITRGSTETTRTDGATRSTTKTVSIGVTIGTTRTSARAEKRRQSVDPHTIYARARVGKILVLTPEEIELLVDAALTEDEAGR